jgi:dienelactone hydrolase
MNRPGIITRIQALPGRTHAGRRIEEAYLHVTFADGRSGAVYAACCLPDGPGPHAAVVHCPGGGQPVGDDDLVWWAGHGFACAAFDWQAGYWGGHDPGRKSCWPPGVVLMDFPPHDWDHALLPLAVQGVGAAIDWLATMPAVDAARVGCTGISWGGYLCWLAGVYEPRLRAIAPTYGCGGLFAPARAWPGTATALAERYRLACDPLALAAQVRAPVAYLGAANDFFGWPAVADRVLAEVPVPSRRCWAPNLNHSVQPGHAALAVAWMRHHLAGGPALPAGPRWQDDRLVVDRPELAAAVERWWTPSPGPDDTRCWWPGEPPPDAPVVARLARVVYADGVALGSAVEPGGEAERNRAAGDLGDAWSEPRAGLGVRCGTQLHGNRTAIEPLGGGAARITSERGDCGVVSFALADPRWNRPGFAGLRLHLAGVAPGSRIGLNLQAVAGARRPDWRGEVVLGADGEVLVDRTTVPLPAAVPWSAVFRLNLDVPGVQEAVLSGLTRLSAPEPAR